MQGSTRFTVVSILAYGKQRGLFLTSCVSQSECLLSTEWLVMVSQLVNGIPDTDHADSMLCMSSLLVNGIPDTDHADSMLCMSSYVWWGLEIWLKVGDRSELLDVRLDF